MEAVTRIEFAHGYLDAEGNPSERAIAQAMREALGRWSLCPRRALFKHARDQLHAGDISTDVVPRVLKRLVALGECEEVEVGHEAYVVAAEPRWIASGNGVGVLLGAAVVPTAMLSPAAHGPDDLVMRVRLESEERAATLTASGVREVSLEEWLQPLGFLRHAARRSGSAIRSDQCDLAAFWALLEMAIGEDGLALGPDAEVRAVMGKPGGFFGRHMAPTAEGRWSDDFRDGVWCAYRRGHGDSHWLPTLIAIDGGVCRALDLYDGDEWRWALLARSRAIGPAEVVQRSVGEVLVTWPLPAQVRAAMDIVGVPTGRWRWRVEDGAPDLWALLR